MVLRGIDLWPPGHPTSMLAFVHGMAEPAGHAFICYVHEDSLAVAGLARALTDAGVRVWLDKTDLWPGEDWRAKIRAAITGDALVFIACFSAASLAKRKSHHYEELNLAIDELRLRPADDPWLVPVRLDDCEVPDRDIGGGRTLRSIQWADLFGPQASAGTERVVAKVLALLGRPAAGPAADVLQPSGPRPEAGPETGPEPADEEPFFGIVTALPEEFAAMLAMIDGERRRFADHDRADYVSGTIPSTDPARPHGVVATVIGDAGTDPAAASLTHLIRSFPSVGCVLMVGIAAGVPQPNRPERHVRLGDVVVGTLGVVGYDTVTDRPGGRVPWLTCPSASSLLVRRVTMLQAGEALGSRPWEDLIAAAAGRLPAFARPPESSDLLYASDEATEPIPHPGAAATEHRAGWPKIHYGRIGSANRSLRNARARDEIADEHDVLAIEMEGRGIGSAGLAGGVEWLVIRGISDYGDTHATRLWRRYAALAAAGYARALLAECPPMTADPVGAARSGTGDKAGGRASAWRG